MEPNAKAAVINSNFRICIPQWKDQDGTTLSVNAVFQKGPPSNSKGTTPRTEGSKGASTQNRPNGLETGQCRKTYEQKIVERFGGQQELDLVIPAPVPQTPEVPQQPSLFGGDEQLLRLAESLAWRDEDDKAAD
jgi:hypothetical protein